MDNNIPDWGAQIPTTKHGAINSRGGPHLFHPLWKEFMHFVIFLYFVLPPFKVRHWLILSFMLANNLVRCLWLRFLNVSSTLALNSGNVLHPALLTSLCTYPHTFSMGLKSGLLGGQSGKSSTTWPRALTLQSCSALSEEALCDGSLSC